MTSARRTDVVLVTYGRQPGLDEDDAPLGPALERLGRTWHAVPWDDAGFDWSSTRLALLRSPWDYSRRRDEFLAWAERAARATKLLNPLETVRANTHKGYLLQLAAARVPVIPTVMTRPGEKVELEAVLRDRGWADVIVKPAVSAGSWRTWRVVRGEASHAWARARRLIATRDALIQPFMPSVNDAGERALVFIDGVLSHAIRKRSLFETERIPRLPLKATPAEIALAHQALLAAGAKGLLYARVDMAPAADGRPLLMELELTEPRLFFREGPPEAVERFARAIAARI